jgi:hypothetical protein
MENKTTVSLPQTEKEWLDAIEFKQPQEHDTVGLVNMKLGYGSSFQLIGEGDEPVMARPILTPFECLTVEDFMSNKGRGQLSLPVTLNQKLWKSLNALDRVFDQFMLNNSKKLFSKQDAEFLKKDPSSILLKHPKPLARYTADNSPDFSSIVRFRVTGRSQEVTSIICSNGRVDKVTFSEMTGVLPPNATRFAMLNGKVLNGRQCISTTIRRDKDFGKGQPKTRVIGPGDFKGGMIHSARFNISHWSLVNGSASIILRMTDVVFENITKAVEVPKGFIIQNEEDLDDEDDSTAEPEDKKLSKRSLDDAFSPESKRLSVDV